MVRQIKRTHEANSLGGVILGQRDVKKDKGICWYPLKDLFYFQTHTLYHPIIFTKNLFDEFCIKDFENRIKMVITGKKNIIKDDIYGPHKFKTIHDCIRYLHKMKYNNTYFILGDSFIYKESLKYCKKLFLLDYDYHPIIDCRYNMLYNTINDMTEIFYYEIY